MLNCLWKVFVMKKSITILFIGTALSALFNCSQPVKPTEETAFLSDSEKVVITAAYDSIAKTADSLIMVDSGITLLSSMVSHYSTFKGIDSVWICNKAMYVLFAKGGIISWEDIRTPAGSELLKSLNSSNSNNLSGISTSNTNRKACVIIGPCIGNSATTQANILKNILQQGCYNTSFIATQEFTLDFIKKDIASYDFIFIASHGGTDGMETKLTTGETVDINLANYLLEKVADDWLKRRLILSSFATDCNTLNHAPTHYVCVTDKFFSYYFARGPFNSSIIYSTSCFFLANDKKMGQILVKAGAKAVVGWDNLSSDFLNIATKWCTQMMTLQSVFESIATLGTESRASIYEKGLFVGYSNLTCWPESSNALLNITGTWSGEESIDLVQTGDCENIQRTISGTGKVIITQNGSNLSFYYPDVGVTRKGNIDGCKLNISGPFMISIAPGYSFLENSFNGIGYISSGQMYCSGDGIGVGGTGAFGTSSSCKLTGKSTATLHRVSPYINGINSFSERSFLSNTAIGLVISKGTSFCIQQSRK
jgi:hypothetical protein